MGTRRCTVGNSFIAWDGSRLVMKRKPHPLNALPSARPSYDVVLVDCSLAVSGKTTQRVEPRGIFVVAIFFGQCIESGYQAGSDATEPAPKGRRVNTTRLFCIM